MPLTGWRVCVCVCLNLTASAEAKSSVMSVVTRNAAQWHYVINRHSHHHIASLPLSLGFYFQSQGSHFKSSGFETLVPGI